MEEIMKKIKYVSLFLLYPFIVNAGTVSDWFDSSIRQLDTPLLSTLALYRSQGLVLIDVNNDYAAYSINAKRLSDVEKEKIGTAESDKSLVLSFNSCASSSGYMLGTINTVSVKNKIDSLEKFNTELRDLISVIESNNSFNKNTFGVSKIKKDQIFLSWKKNDGTTIEVQFNNQPHTLVAIASKPCK